MHYTSLKISLTLALAASLNNAYCDFEHMPEAPMPITIASDTPHHKNEVQTNEPISIPANMEQKPTVKSKFFSAEMIKAIPKLQYLNETNPDFNKILLKLEGFPKNQEIILEINRPLGKNSDKYMQVTTFKIQDDDTYLTPDGKTHPFFIGTSKGFYPGERISYRFRTEDDSASYEGSGVPMPIVLKDNDDNVLMRAELLSIDPTVYVIDLPTVENGEEYELVSTSIGQTIKSKVKFNPNKPFHYKPAAESKNNGGNATLKIVRNNGDVYSLRLPWGTALEIYEEGGKCYPFHNIKN